MYTIKNAKTENITCDGNGAYLKTRTNKWYYCLLAKDGRIITKIVHSSDDENIYFNQRNGRDYEAIRVDINDVYLIERYYRQNKSIPLLKEIIVRRKAVKTGLYENNCCVVYTKSRDEQSAKVESLLPHGNTKSFTQLYIKTSPYVLTDLDCLVSQNINNDEIYDTLLERSGGSHHSKGMFEEPRNIKQIKNRKQQLKSSSKYNKHKRQTNDKLTTLFNAPENVNIVQSISAVKSGYFLFLHNDRQINDINKFCCEDSNLSALPIDTIFNLCDLWITDTS